jgi:uncharacterized protein YggE
MKTIFLFLLVPFILFAQENIENTIHIRATSTLFIPADAVKMIINISCENEVPRTAFIEHKSLENKLMELIQKYHLTDSLVNYTLLSFRPGYKPNVVSYVTSQEVSLSLKSISDYINFQLDLLENGFKNFRATFSSSGISFYKEEGYKAALKLAENDASMIAKAMGKTIGEMYSVNVNVTDFPYNDPAYSSGMVNLRVAYDSKELTELPQTVKVQTNVDVVFALDD